ncbi:hypothetical protein [Suipraeoptans intestinalis]|uniref:hypothetical protein n=1 Tax=Suipraeoptans intestinalis TaxID=2606628 RepID=UPI001F2D763A|nr:hypothetical protein [Suipraeoptans intestinalis]
MKRQESRRFRLPGEEFDAGGAKLKEAKITPITGDGAYATSFLGYHLGRYLGQDGVKALVGDPAVKEKVEAGEIEAVSWDDPRVAQAAKDLEDFASKGYFSENIESNVYPAGQNQEFAPGMQQSSSADPGCPTRSRIRYPRI